MRAAVVLQLVLTLAVTVAAQSGGPAAKDSTTTAGAPARVYGSWLEGRPGYYPPSDPESMAVVTGRRAAKPIDLPLTGGRDSLSSLARAVLSALAAARPDSLAALCVTRAEFEHILWLDFPESRPVTGLTAEDAWRPLAMRLSGGIAGAMSELGGRQLRLERVEATLGVKEYVNFRLHRGIVITARDETTGERVETRFLRTVVERKGRYKIYSTDD
jgi:hypothetical protein